MIFSVIYRTWASLRSQQLLRALAPRMDIEAYGFLPGCEPSQLWLLLQAEIEDSLQCNYQLCGLSTDLQRAFNFILRQHTMALATHLGMPSCVTTPWKLFLDNCTRSFEVRGSLSCSTTSSCGMPEGDALSVYGMTQLCFTWHLYMRVYCPSVRSLSFVDNLSVVAQVTGDLVHGLAYLLEFFRLWNVKIDEGKSYCWALTTEQRRHLVALPFQKVEHARELGGVMSFTRRRFTGLQQQRLAKLAAVWRRLRQSKAPLRLKLSAVPTVCWTSALHGINGSCLFEACGQRRSTRFNWPEQASMVS